MLRCIYLSVSNLFDKVKTQTWPLQKSIVHKNKHIFLPHSDRTTPLQYEQAWKAPNTTRCYSYKYKMDMDKLLKAITLNTIKKKKKSPFDIFPSLSL